MTLLQTLGLIQIACGVAVFVIDIANFASLSSHAIIVSAGASGIWAGTFYLIAGLCGFRAGRVIAKGEKSPFPSLYCSLILSAVSAVLAVSLVIAFSVFLSVEEEDLIYCSSRNTQIRDRYSSVCTFARGKVKEFLPAYLVFSLIMLLVSVSQCVNAATRLARSKYTSVNVL
ncbi:uncharacterized protein LOC129598242 [Paramacrobiotus metropolitanus]|uniref:uncharacterized protein LOC129598242 n=1 Tax=Paramacrobiotus metropolitanus TaxID=2943436 RepID=UPI002445F8F1|nr:uncharacterized protein LOC129598242 [Paramacrobiotus metropolitanus]